MTKKRLSQPQLKAIRHGQGPLLIIAGAGTGKTTVITERIKFLISQGLAKPSEILALTFTEKAAREMETRVDQALPMGWTQMWISTFHSFCDRVLRNEALHIGLDPGFVLMTEAESLLFLRRRLFDLPLDYFRPRGNPTKFLEGLLQHFNRLRDEDLSVDDYLKHAQKQARKKKVSQEEKKKIKELASAFKKYQQLKEKEAVVDFADLISLALRLFREKPNVLEQYQKQFRYVLVDEFQDTNIAQNELAILLAGKKANLAVTGDDDQSIYRFRGAAASNIIQFRGRFPKAKLVVLTYNYRSTNKILNAAYRLIQHNNPDRLEAKEKIQKKLTAARKIPGQKPQFILSGRVENEAEAVAREIKRLHNQGKYRYQDFAILVRANDHAHPFIQALSRAGIPYQFLGPGKLLRQPEVKDLIAYLKVLYNFEDDVALFRVLTMPILKLSARDLAAIRNFARRYNLSLFEACEEVAQKESARPRPRISQKSLVKIKKIVDMIHRHLGLIPKETAGQILYFFLEETGLLKELSEYKTLSIERRALNISKLFDRLKTYEAEHEDASVLPVVDWLNMKLMIGESPLAADLDWTEVNAVNLLTIHSAKGLEFSVVFLVNLVSQRFPTIHRREQIPLPEELIKEILPEGDYHQQEERRLFYVGITRAQDRLYLTAANYYGEGRREKKISPFVYEALGEVPFKKPTKRTGKQLSMLDWQKPAAPEPALVAQTPINYLSYSQIDVFKTCPLQYKFKYLLRLPVPPSAAQSFGDSLHKTLGDLYQRRPSKKNLLSLLKKNWNPLGYSSQAHEKKMFAQAKKILEDFYQKAYDPKTTPLALEQNFVFPLTRGLKIGGRIDRVDQLTGNKIEIIDYKTGKPKSQEELADDLQMNVYLLAATDPGIYGKKPKDVILSFYFLTEQEKVSAQKTPQQAEAAKKELIKIAEAIQKSNFPATPSRLCDFCEYKLLCEAWQ